MVDFLTCLLDDELDEPVDGLVEATSAMKNVFPMAVVGRIGTKYADNPAVWSERHNNSLGQTAMGFIWPFEHRMCVETTGCLACAAKRYQELTQADAQVTATAHAQA